MSVYFLAAINRENLDLYRQYEAAGFASIQTFGVDALAVSDAPAAIEGPVPARRIILLRFPDQKALDAWYQSTDYQQAIALRHASSETKFIFSFEGLDEN